MLREYEFHAMANGCAFASATMDSRTSVPDSARTVNLVHVSLRGLLDDFFHPGEVSHGICRPCQRGSIHFDADVTHSAQLT